MVQALNQEAVAGETEAVVATRRTADRTHLEATLEIKAILVVKAITRIKDTTVKVPRTMVTEIIIVTGMMAVKAKIGELDKATLTATPDLSSEAMVDKVTTDSLRLHSLIPTHTTVLSNLLPALTKDLLKFPPRTMRMWSMLATSVTKQEMMT
jgi:hypothetical protein